MSDQKQGIPRRVSKVETFFKELVLWLEHGFCAACKTGQLTLLRVEARPVVVPLEAGKSADVTVLSFVDVFTGQVVCTTASRSLDVEAIARHIAAMWEPRILHLDNALPYDTAISDRVLPGRSA